VLLVRLEGKLEEGGGGGTYNEFEVFCSVNLSTASIVVKGCGESLILSPSMGAYTHMTQRKDSLNAVNMTGLPRYCQYSGLGIGSRNEAGNERSLRCR
jgi:hypothetical protein